MDIRQLREKGLYYKQIGEELDVVPRTAAKYCRDEAETEGKIARPGILDEYKEYVVTRMGEGVTNAVVMQRELRARGYKGSISTLRAFMAPLEIADELLEALGLDEIRNILPQRLERAANSNMSYSDFLVDLLMTERDAKRERYI